MSVNIVFPGGVSVEFSGLDTIEGYYRALNTLSIGMSPFKLVLDVIDIFLELQKVLEEVPGIVSDPAAFLEALQKLIRKISLIAQFIPQTSIPLMVNGVLNTVLELLDTLDTQLDTIESLENKLTQLDSVIDLDPALQAVKVLVETQKTNQEQSFAQMVAPLNSLLDLVNFFLNLIGSSYSFPSITGGTTSELREAIDKLRIFIETITY